MLIEGAEPVNDQGYFIIKDEPKQHLHTLELGVPLLKFFPQFRERKKQMEFRVSAPISLIKAHPPSYRDAIP